MDRLTRKKHAELYSASSMWYWILKNEDPKDSNLGITIQKCLPELLLISNSFF